MKKVLFTLIGIICSMGLMAQTPDSWTIENPANTSVSEETSNVNEGTSAMAVTLITQEQENTEIVSASFTVTPGASYTATVDVYENDAAGRARMAINWDGSNDYGNFSSDGDTWETIEMTGTVPDSVTTAQVFFRFYDIIDNWDGDFGCILDNVTFSENGGSNLVTNGGFETWSTVTPNEYTIEEIQDTTGTGSGASAVAGETVITSGVISAIYDNMFVIHNHESADGKWSAVWVQNNGTSINEVDAVDVTGVVTEAYGKTLINATDVVVTGQPDIAITPYEVSTQMANDEAYEAVLVECTGNCTNENPDEGGGKEDFGEWVIDDGSGEVRVNDLGLESSYEPTLGNEYEVIGVMNYDFSNFKIEPRSLSDITETGQGTDPMISITSPAEGATVNTADVTVSFNVMNFVPGTDGKIAYSIDGAAVSYQETADPIDFNGLSESTHTVELELVDMSETPLDPTVTASVNFTVDLSAGPEITPIYDIQYTEAGSGDSPMDGETVTVAGIVTAIDGDKFWMQDAPGAWNGIYIYYISGTGPAIGDSVVVEGEVSEYNGLTEITPTDFTNLSSGHTPQVTVVQTGNAPAEMYESVLVQVEGENTAAPDQYNEWPVNDGSGPVNIDDHLYEYTPTVGNTYRVTGIVEYFYDFKILPRDAEDVEDLGINTDPNIIITSPAGGATIYTESVTVEFNVSNFVLGTDGKVAYSIDGGSVSYQENGDPIVFSSLSDGAHSVLLELVDMSNNPLDPAESATVSFTINLSGPAITPIYDIQYTAEASGDSPMEDETVYVKGVVTASFNDCEYGEGEGYYIQDAGGAWNGIQILDADHTPAIGDSVMLSGDVTEYYSMTQIENVSDYSVVSVGGVVADPVIVTTADASSEEYESVLIKVEDAICITEENQYGEWAVNNGTADADSLGVKDNGCFSFSATEGTHYDIIGVINYSYGDYFLQYRIASDVSESNQIVSSFAADMCIYPNPASDVIQVENLNGVESISVFNLHGQEIYHTNITGNTHQIHISGWAKGLYILKASSDQDQHIMRIEKL